MGDADLLPCQLKACRAGNIMEVHGLKRPVNTLRLLFHTFPAAALVAGGLSANAQLVAVGNAAAGNSSAGANDATFVPGQYYYLQVSEAGVTGTMASDANLLAYLKGTVQTDSLGLVEDATLTTSELTDRALWKVVKVLNPATGALSHWTFENKYTGTLLAEGSVNSFEWIADGVPADGSSTPISLTATELKSTQGLDVTKGEYYEFREVVTLNEKFEIEPTVNSLLKASDILKGKKFSRALELVKFNSDGDVVGAWNNTTTVAADRTYGGYFAAAAAGTNLVTSVNKGVKLTINAGAKFVLDEAYSTTNDNEVI